MAAIIPFQRYLQEVHSIIEGGAVINTPRDGGPVVCPSMEFITDDFLPKLDSITLPYIVNTYDCEDYCAESQILMTRSLAANEAYQGLGHSLGYAEIIIPNGVTLNGVTDSVHATNLIRLDNGSWWFMEPQPSRERMALPAKPSTMGFAFGGMIRESCPSHFIVFHSVSGLWMCAQPAPEGV